MINCLDHRSSILFKYHLIFLNLLGRDIAYVYSRKNKIVIAEKCYFVVIDVVRILPNGMGCF